MIKAICYTHIGKRPTHEDNFCLGDICLKSSIQLEMVNQQLITSYSKSNTPTMLYAISDGMGGQNAGEIASRICVEKLAQLQKSLQWCTNISDAVAKVQLAIIQINDIVCKLSFQQDNLIGMGATLVILIACNEKYAILNIGDSRAYYFNGFSLKQLTKDHTEGQRMLDLGLLTRKEIFNFPARKNLNRYVGYNENGGILQADVFYPNINEGLFILCSDGITDAVTDNKLLALLTEGNDLMLIGEKIINLATKTKNADNATLILVSIER